MSHEIKHDDVVVIDREELEVKPPKRYDLVLLNDDYSSMDWVVHILQELFGKSEDEAGRIMLLVHTKGEGVAQSGLSHDIATSKAMMVINYSQSNGYPLQVVAREV
jgi:ATP-dependent Clp protease adaptor protein ClpS